MILLAALLAGIIALDGTSFPQAMISRPLVAGALAGWVVGMPENGAILGAILEAFHLAILPIGAARYPESGTAAAAAIFAWAWASTTDSGAALLLALAFALGWERLTGGSVTLQRRVNEAIVSVGGGPRTPGTLQARHLLAMLADFCRGVLVTLGGALVGMLWLTALDRLWTHGPDVAQGVAVAAAAGTAAALLRVFGGWTARWKLFAAGVGTGLLVLLVR